MAKKYLFSYGSNNPDQLSGRLERDLEIFPAIAYNYQKVYRGYSNNWKGGTASLNTKPGFNTFGYITEVNERDLKLIDRYEGVNIGKYSRKKIKVTIYDDDGKEHKVDAIYYKNKSLEFNRPSEKYLKENLKTLNHFWTDKSGKKFNLKFLKDRIR